MKDLKNQLILINFFAGLVKTSIYIIIKIIEKGDMSSIKNFLETYQDISPNKLIT